MEELSKAMIKADGLGLVLNQIITNRFQMLFYSPDRTKLKEGDVVKYNTKWKREMIYRPNPPHPREGQWRAMFVKNGNNAVHNWSMREIGYGATPEEAITNAINLIDK